MHQEQRTDRVHLFPPTSAKALADLLLQHWPDLTAGPDLELESAAEKEYHNRIREFARQFVALCRQVAERRSDHQ